MTALRFVFGGPGPAEPSQARLRRAFARSHRRSQSDRRLIALSGGFFLKKFRKFSKMFQSFRTFLQVEVSGLAGTCSDLFGCIRMHLDVFGSIRTLSENLLTARFIFGHFVPAMGSRKSPPKAGHTGRTHPEPWCGLRPFACAPKHRQKRQTPRTTRWPLHVHACIDKSIKNREPQNGSCTHLRTSTNSDERREPRRGFRMHRISLHRQKR